jgi:hypothetical protein
MTEWHSKMESNSDYKKKKRNIIQLLPHHAGWAIKVERRKNVSKSDAHDFPSVWGVSLTGFRMTAIEEKKVRYIVIYYIAHSGCYTVRWPFCIEEEEEKSGRLSRSIKKRRWCSPDSQWLSTSAYIHNSAIIQLIIIILWLLWWYLFYSFVGSYTNPFSSMYSAELLTMLDTTKDNITNGRRENLGEIFKKKIYIKRREKLCSCCHHWSW